MAGRPTRFHRDHEPDVSRAFVIPVKSRKPLPRGTRWRCEPMISAEIRVPGRANIQILKQRWIAHIIVLRVVNSCYG